jgi:hypothetical protein
VTLGVGQQRAPQPSIVTILLGIALDVIRHLVDISGVLPHTLNFRSSLLLSVRDDPKPVEGSNHNVYFSVRGGPVAPQRQMKNSLCTPPPPPKSKIAKQKTKNTHAHPPPRIDRRLVLSRVYTTLHLHCVHRVHRVHRVTRCIAPSPRARLRPEPVEGALPSPSASRALPRPARWGAICPGVGPESRTRNLQACRAAKSVGTAVPVAVRAACDAVFVDFK